MRIQPFIVLLMLFLCTPLYNYGQKNSGSDMPVKVVPFIVRNGDVIKNIAPRIKVPVREILKANKIRSASYVAYPGRVLLLPIHTQPKTWDPTREDMTGNSPSREDRGISDDYDIVIDSSNYALDEDFISVDEIRGDSVEYDNIDGHIRKVDRRISYLYYKIDSLKQADFSFDDDGNNNTTVQEKMKMTRDKYYLEGPLGRQLDSLKTERSWLGQRRIILRNKITEYEYLADNASYSERHFVPEERDKSANWGDHLAYEAKYLKNKSATAYQNQSVVPAQTEAAKPEVAEVPLSEPVKTPVVVRESPNPGTQGPPVITGTIAQPAPLKPVPTIQIDMADLGPPDNGTDASYMSKPTRYRSDFSLLPKLKFRNEIMSVSQVSATLPYMNMLPVSKPVINTGPAATSPPATNPATATASVSKSLNTTAPVQPGAPTTVSVRQAVSEPKPAPTAVTTIAAQPAADIAPSLPKDTAPVVKPVAEKAASPPPAAKDTVKKMRGQLFAFDSLTGTFIAIPNSEKPKALETRIDTVVAKPVVKVNPDPLATYNADSGFASQKVQIKEIPVNENKSQPKYLIPVDSSAIVKGDFYLIRARQVLEKGDFKTGDKYLRKSLELDPNNAAAWMLHADLFLTQGLADQALKEYLIAGEIDSANPKVFYNIALLYTKANDPQKAYMYFTKSIDASDKYILAYMGRASLEMAEHDYTGAISDYGRVVAINKYYSPAFKARGLARMEAGQFAAAVVDFDQYLSIEDPDSYIIYERGLSKIYSNSLLQGCLDLSSALQLGYKDADKAIKKFCQ